MGHYCRICGRNRPNEKFSGRGHRDHVCKDCQRMPREERQRIERLDELRGFLEQSHISQKNLKRLEALRRDAEPETASLAAFVEEVARVAPYKRRRWIKVAQRDRALFEKAVQILGLEYFEDLAMEQGGFDSPLGKLLEELRFAPPWTERACHCDNSRAFRDCRLQRENEQAEEEMNSGDRERIDRDPS